MNETKTDPTKRRNRQIYNHSWGDGEREKYRVRVRDIEKKRGKERVQRHSARRRSMPWTTQRGALATGRGVRAAVSASGILEGVLQGGWHHSPAAPWSLGGRAPHEVPVWEGGKEWS